MIEPLILAAFSFFNGLRVISYLPQMLRIARDAGGATAVSYLTWSLWLCANISTAAYAGVIIGDPALCLISIVNILCCGIVLCLTMYKRRSWRASNGGIAKSRAVIDAERASLASHARQLQLTRILPSPSPPPC